MENNGWVKIHRKFLDWEWYDDINVKVLFLHLLLVVNHKDRKWRGIDIRRGQKLTSYSHLAEETCLSVQQVRTSLDKLESTGEITKLSGPLYTVITIKNYNKYQEVTSQPTNEQQTSNKPVTTNKNDKNEKNDKNIKKGIDVGSIKILLEEKTIKEFSTQFNLSFGDTTNELNKMVDWLKSKGKVYKDYKAFARNWFRRIESDKPKEQKRNILNL